jgi:hypothetical protein
MMGIGGYQCFRAGRVDHLEVYLIDNIYGEEAVEDQQFLKRRKVLETLRSNPEMYFLHLDSSSATQEIRNSRDEILVLKRVNPTRCRDIIWKANNLVLYHDMLRAWEAVNRFNIINCLEDTKAIIKQLSKDEARESKWMQLANK